LPSFGVNIILAKLSKRNFLIRVDIKSIS